MLISFLKGFCITASLVIAIGAQNIFALKQGLLRSHILLVVLLCWLIDMLLITIGVSGIGQIMLTNPIFLHITKYGGALFLTVYGIKSFYAAYQGDDVIVLDSTNRESLYSIILNLLIVSFLNPHTYLDTMILIGSVGARYDHLQRISFIAGASLASLIWFILLCYGARYLAPYFRKPEVWRIFNICIGITMWAIACSLLVLK